jgi:hypothetical protein
MPSLAQARHDFFKTDANTVAVPQIAANTGVDRQPMLPLRVVSPIASA